ncbi:hypothetical protein [Deinococcus pimensis]|nr:hypothetical protein [Deinococcus pimensis]
MEHPPLTTADTLAASAGTDAPTIPGGGDTPFIDLRTPRLKKRRSAR